MSAAGAVLAALVCGCSGGTSSSTGGVPATAPTSAAAPTATPTAIATATPAATPAPLPVLGLPSALVFTTAGQFSTFSASQGGFAGAFTVTGCSGIVTAASAAPNGPAATFTVTALAAGSCNLTVQGAPGSSPSAVAVTVTTLSGSIQ
ncbi:MAG: hypothetical protein JWO85_42 [Candidatus Eremiobacteraeota bacterium]|nr:hypothetical protein [Candidatus Eremiobacteraeota bacterium]